jgi:hypothetical protein
MLLVGLAWYWWIPIVAVPLVFALPIVLTVAAALFEKRIVWYFEPAQVTVSQATSPLFNPMNPYAVGGQTPSADVPPPDVQAAAAIASAKEHGFQPLGVFRDAKGRSTACRGHDMHALLNHAASLQKRR